MSPRATGEGNAPSTRTMPAVVVERPLLLILAQRPVPVPADPHDVVVRIEATGICGTDRGIASGHFPASPGAILGHEAGGYRCCAGRSAWRAWRRAIAS